MGTPVPRRPRAMASPMAVPAPAISPGGSNAFRRPVVRRSTSVSFSVNNRDPPYTETAAVASLALAVDHVPVAHEWSRRVHRHGSPGIPALIVIATSPRVLHR